MCHALLYDQKFLALLLRIDHDLAARRRADGCQCGGALHPQTFALARACM